MTPSPVSYYAVAHSHVGRRRRRNEDAYLIRDDVGLWMVADGMGGSSSGEYASGLVVASLKSVPAAASAAQLVWETESALRDANRRLQAEALAAGNGAMYGSTVVALLAHGDDIACVWAGDSRLYRLRAGALTQVTHDHSEVQELIDDGVLATDEARRHPSANVVTRAVGVADELALEVARDKVRSLDRYLLCSDGLTKMVPDAEIAVLMANGSIDSSAHALIDRALDRGGLDNVTVVVVEARAGAAG